MFQKKMSIIAIGLVLLSGSVSAQELIANDKDEKRTKRKEKVEQRKQAREAEKLKGVTALFDEDFVLKAREIAINSNRSPRSIQNRLVVADKYNFVKIEGNEIKVQYGFATRSARANGGGVQVFQGEIDSFSVKDKGEGRNFAAVIDFRSPNSNNLLSVHIVIAGKKAQARFYDGLEEVLFEGIYERASEAKLWHANQRIRTR